MTDLIRSIQIPDMNGFFEILILAVGIYFVLLFLRGTRGAQVLTGFVFALVSLLVLTRVFHFDALNWLLKHISVYLAAAFIVIFHPEIRRALAELGKQHVFVASRNDRTLVDRVVQAVLLLSQRKIGALIAIKQEIGLRSIIETGTRLDSRVTPELLSTIFFPHTPLHDGGVVVDDNHIVAAGCLFPLSQKEELNKALGTRHRAAIGLTEETDAIVIVVSEETGTVSVAYRGRLSRGMDEDRLRKLLVRVLVRGRRTKSRMARVREQLDLTPDGVAKTEAQAGQEGGADAG